MENKHLEPHQVLLRPGVVYQRRRARRLVLHFFSDRWISIHSCLSAWLQQSPPFLIWPPFFFCAVMPTRAGWDLCLIHGRNVYREEMGKKREKHRLWWVGHWIHRFKHCQCKTLLANVSLQLQGSVESCSLRWTNTACVMQISRMLLLSNSPHCRCILTYMSCLYQHFFCNILSFGCCGKHISLFVGQWKKSDSDIHHETTIAANDHQ